MKQIEPITQAEWAAKVRATEASIAYAAKIARDRERKREARRRIVREWILVGMLFAIILLVLALAGSLD